MKELEEQKQAPIEIREEQQQKKELKLIGSLLRRPGQTLFEINLTTGEINPATYKAETLELKGIREKVNVNLNTRLKVEVKENCYYIQALNKKNAIRKFNKRTA